MVYRYGPEWSGSAAIWKELDVRGGQVFATNMWDLCRPTKRITRIGTSDPIVQLPDGVEIGTKIPFGRTWRGYTYFMHGDGNSAWRKRVSVNNAKIEVKLFMSKGRVTSIMLDLGWNLRCGG
jgi:hypothetical protein